MSCRLTQAIKPFCSYSMGGVLSVYLVSRSLIGSYQYTDSNLNVITGITGAGGGAVPWLEFHVTRSVVGGGENMSRKDPGTTFAQDIDLLFAEMEAPKRAILENLLYDTVACIVVDAQRRYWLFGQDFGLTVNKYRGRIQEWGKSNDYALTLSAEEKFQIREVESTLIVAAVAINGGGPVIGGDTDDGIPDTNIAGGGPGGRITEDLDTWLMPLYQMGNFPIIDFII